MRFLNGFICLSMTAASSEVSHRACADVLTFEVPSSVTKKEARFWKKVMLVEKQLTGFEKLMNEMNPGMNFDYERTILCDEVRLGKLHSELPTIHAEDYWVKKSLEMDQLNKYLFVRSYTWYRTSPRLAKSCHMYEPITVGLKLPVRPEDPVFMRLKELARRSPPVEINSLCDILVKYTRLGEEFQNTAIEELRHL